MTLKLEAEFSDEDLAAIGHVVADPKEWARHAFEHVGANAIRSKILKYADSYAEEKYRLGADYKTRAERDAIEAQIQALEDAAAQEQRDAETKAAEEAERLRFEAAVRAAVAHIGQPS